MNLTWRTFFAGIVALAIIILAAWALAAYLDSSKVPPSLAAALVSVLFLGLSPLERVIETIFAQKDSTTLATQRSWFSVGLASASIIIVVNVLLGMAMTAGVFCADAFYAGVRHVPVPTEAQAEQHYTQVLSSGAVGGVMVLVFIYLGLRIFARTRSWILPALILTAVLYSAIDGGLLYLENGDVHAGLLNAYTDLVLCLPFLLLGALFGWVLRLRSTARIEGLARRVPRDKREAAYKLLADLIGATPAAGTRPS